jgi:hypothetical protein
MPGSKAHESVHGRGAESRGLEEPKSPPPIRNSFDVLYRLSRGPKRPTKCPTFRPTQIWLEC